MPKQKKTKKKQNFIKESKFELTVKKKRNQAIRHYTVKTKPYETQTGQLASVPGNIFCQNLIFNIFFKDLLYIYYKAKTTNLQHT